MKQNINCYLTKKINGLKHFNDLEVSIEYSNEVDDNYDNI